MYFNRKNAEQKNWRMIKKGKHFLFGCSLVFAVGASLATQMVHANTAEETTVESGSKAEEAKPGYGGEAGTYEAPAVAENKPEVAGTPAVAAKLDGETAKEVKALDKTKLENYIAEIEAKLANGTYDNKTEESVAVLKADLEAAKATLANATTQDEITKAYNKLVTTANTKLKNKPVEKKETPAVDTTNGKETVGKKAENTEKKSESNSIENTGSNDPRNGKALDKNNAFRAEVAYSEGTNAAANGHSDAYILNDVNRYTSTDDAVNVVSRVTNYKVKYNKDNSGKITSLDWLVFYNDHAENLANTYNTDGGDVYRNFIQIPAEVNMPTSITRAKYNSPINPKFINGKVQRIKPDGSALSNSVTFENPAPATAAGLPLDKKDTFALASGWESTLYGRSIEKLAGQEDRYFKSASSDSSPRTKQLVYGAALNDKRLIVDRSTTGGSGYDGYVWSFRTAVPETTTNEQLKDMKVVFGMMRSATAGANAGFANIATNPVKMWQSDVSPEPTAKNQTVKAGQQPDATKSIGNFDTLPQGTTVKYKDTVDTKTPGEKPATVVVTYPDTSTKEVPVKVIVEKEAVAPAKPVTPKPEAPKPSTPAAGAATNKPAAGAATNKPAAGAATNKPAAEAETRGPEIVNDLAGKASTPADVTVKAPAGSTVKLYNTDGVVIGEAVANAQGVATVHPTNSLPAGEITATSTPVGGKESAKSAPITVTASPVTVKDGGVTGNDDTRLLVSRSEITVYPGDKIDVDVVAQATALEKFSVEKNATAIKGVLPSGGYLGSSNGATIRQRDAKYSGTVAMDQPAGSTSVIFHAKNRDKPTTIYRELIVNVLETAKKYEPVAGTKLDVSDSNNLSEDDKNKVIAAVKAANPSLPADSQYSVDEKGNLTITYPDGSKDKIAAAYLVNPTTPAAPAVAPTVEIPYSNADKRQIYVYTGENTDLTFTGKDETTVKDLYLRGPGGVTNDNAAAYGFTTGKIDNGAVTNGEGTVSADKRTATIKMTGVTTLKAPNQWTSFIEAKDNDDLKSMTGADYNASTDDAVRQQKPGYIQFVVKSQTDKYDIKAPTEKVAVADPANVTEDDLAKIKEKLQLEYNQNNDDANISKNAQVTDKDAKIASVTKDDKGNLVVTYTDGSKDTKPLSEFVGVAPTVEVPYSNADKRQIYVYTGENTDLTFTGKDETTVKDLYLRGPGGVTNDNATQYGFTVGKIDNGAVTNGEGTVSKDKRTATIKMTGVTTLKAPNQWTSFIEAKDNEDIKSNISADYNASTDDAVRQQKPGYVQFVVKSQTDKYDIKAPTEKVAVADPANVTEADLAKIKEKLQLEYKKDNDDANISKDAPVTDKDAKIKSLTKDADGNLVVTYTDGSTDKKPLSEFVGVAPTVEVPYSNADKRQIYVYTGENTDLTFTGKDETEVKDLYLRGPGDVTWNNTTGFGFTTGKVENGVVTGDGTVTADKRTATIKMTGTTNLKAGQQWTSFIESKDSNDAKSMTGANYNAETDDAARQQKPGYVQFVVKSQTDKYDIKAPTEKVAVTDPANVTEAELAKIKEKLQLEHNKNNDDANISKNAPVTDKDAKIASVTKDDQGNLVVTYADGSKDTRPLSEFVTKDTEAPAKPVVETDLTGKAGTKTPVKVTAEAGSKVELFDKDGNKIGEGTADENGKATITPTKELPAGDVTAKATDPAGNVSEPSTPEKATADTKAPAKPEIKTDLTDKAGTKTPVEVTAEPGSKVELFDKDGNKIGEGTADENGKATITPTKELPAGDVTAKATDPAGNVSEPSTPEKATADTKAPAKPVVETDLTGKAGTKTPVEVTAEPGSKVELFDKAGNKIGEGTADENGKATITPTKELPAGDVTAKATDPAGNVSESSTPEKATADTKAPAKPEIKTDLTDKAGTKTPVEVTAEPGSKVELFDKDGNKIGEGTADENGKATITPTKELPAGDVTAKATDPAGNVSEPSTPEKATADTKAPAKPEIKTDLTDKAGTKTPVEVSAEPGSKVELFDKDGHKLGEGVADENGKATITPTKELPAGDVTAKATDPAGNVSEPSVPATATKDTTAPAKPEVKTDLTDKAGTKTPVEVSAEPGSKVELFDKDGHKLGEGVADENGKATITPTKELPAGDVTAKATDPAGNVSEPSVPATATKDTTAPAKPEVKTDLTDKAGTKTPVEVSAEPGSKVELFDKDGHKLGEGVADENGKATITPTKELPAGDVTAKATDPAGNVSEPSVPATATKDTTAPAKPEVKTDLTDKAGTKTPVEVSAEQGSKVELFDKDGHKLGEGVADENGKATITPTKELPAGDVTAKATDPAGNVSEPSVPATATKDTTAPAKPEVKTDLTDKAGTKTPVEVSAEPGSKVELFDKDGHKLGEGVADENGKATITPTKELPAGDVTAKATDPAGNVSEPSVPATATKDTTAPAKPEVKTDLTDKAGTKTPVEVSAEQGSKVELFDKDGHKLGEGVADENGKATITPTKELPAGDVTAKATDPAGNVSEPSVPATATKDTTAPAKPEVKTDLTDKAGTKTPVEVSAEPGSKVELFDKDGHKLGEGVADENGKATITPTRELPAGDVTAKATDPAGNVSEPSVPATATKDTTAPAKPEVKTDLTDKAGTKTPVEVSAEPGSKVELFDKDGHKLGEGVADENGKATITPTKELPAGDVTAKATDPAGNVSEPSVPATATKDTTAPAKPEVKTDLTDKAGTKTPVEVSAEPGSKVELFDKDGHKLGEGVADENGKATITPTRELPAGDVTAKATDPAGNVSEPSVPATATKDTKAPAKPAVTPVVDPSNLTEAEKAKVADEVKKSNPTVTDVKVGQDGTTTVTFPDGSTAVIPSGDTVKKSSDNAVKDPAVTPVVDPSNLTEAEKAKVADEVKKSNPTVTDVKVGKDGTTTVTFPDGSTAVIPSGDTVKKSSDNAVKDPAVTPVVDPSNLTEAEKAKVADEVKKSNPTVTDVKVGQDGTTTVTYPDGTTAVIPSADTVKKSSDNAVKDPAVTPVVDPSNLTEAEKAKVADEVKKSNPTVTDVKVGQDGTTTVTYPDGSTAVIPSGDTVKKSSDNAVKDPAVTPVVDPSNLTEAEKAKVADEVKKSNPTVTDVKVGQDGTTTVTYPDGSTAVIPSGDTVKKSSDNAVKDPAVTPVVDPSNLTEAEKAKVADEVKKSNPTVTDVKVGQDGTTTVTYPDGTTAVIPSDKAVKKSSDNAVKDPAVTPVVDPSNLTEAEKAKVADEVKKSNPTVTDVKVGQDGTTTVTYPDGTTAVIPSDKAVKKSSDNAVKDPAVTPVVDPSNLTEAEKAKVADEVKKSNPTVTDVKVGRDGTTTVTYPDGTTAVIPSADTVKKSSDNAVKDPAVTPVVDPSNLTEAEKAKVADEVKKSNPTVTDVKVGQDGTTTVTYPDGSTAVIPSGDTVKKSSDNAGNDVVKLADKTVVANPEKLTDAEKKAIEDKVKAVNPGATVVVDDKGNATVTTPAGNTAVIPAADLTKSAEDIFKQRPYAPSNGGGNNGATNTDAKVDKAKLEGAIRQLDELIIKESAKLDAETAKEANALSADAKKVFANADASQAEVDAMVKRIEDFMAKVASSTDYATPANDQAAQTPAVAPATTQAAANASQEAATNARKAAKELPNTGTADSTVAMVAAAASALLGLGLAGRRRKEDEEA